MKEFNDVVRLLIKNARRYPAQYKQRVKDIKKFRKLCREDERFKKLAMIQYGCITDLYKTAQETWEQLNKVVEQKK